MYDNLSVGVVIPARDEQENIGIVIQDLLKLANVEGQPLVDDVVVCNNDSSDATAERAEQHGARVVFEPQAGYGMACLTALSALHDVDVVVFVDADQSVRISEMAKLLEPILNGADLVIGSRTLGEMQKGALSVPQLVGNQVAGILILLLWHQRVTDLGPFRAISMNALDKLRMQDQSYGWTVEMQIKAMQHGMRIVEVPVSTNRRKHGKSKIGGTFKGVVGASIGILGMIFKLLFHRKRT